MLDVKPFKHEPSLKSWIGLVEGQRLFLHLYILLEKSERKASKRLSFKSKGLCSRYVGANDGQPHAVNHMKIQRGVACESFTLEKVAPGLG